MRKIILFFLCLLIFPCGGNAAGLYISQKDKDPKDTKSQGRTLYLRGFTPQITSSPTYTVNTLRFRTQTGYTPSNAGSSEKARAAQLDAYRVGVYARVQKNSIASQERVLQMQADRNAKRVSSSTLNQKVAQEAQEQTVQSQNTLKPSKKRIYIKPKNTTVPLPAFGDAGR